MSDGIKNKTICEESFLCCQVITGSIPQAPSVPRNMFLMQYHFFKGNFPSMTMVVYVDLPFQQSY